MKQYKVSANLIIGATAWVDAESEEDAKTKAIVEFKTENYELGDLIDEPKINWAELDDDCPF